MWLEVVYALTFTVPKYGAYQCDSLVPQERWLDHGDLWGWPQGGGRQHLQTLAVAGREGGRDTISVDLAGVWTLMVTVTDLVGKESCPGNFVTVGGTTGVEAGAGAKEEWYDVAGRRLDGKPRRSGVYFVRRSGGVREIVVFR